jgi:uncharacterized Tic20 family protein
MMAHVGTLAGSVVPFGNVLAPLIVWLTQRHKSSFASKHARESLVFQIALMVGAVALVLLVVVSLGALLIFVLPAIVGLLLADLVYMILATVRASEGKIWEYPVTTRFVS